MKETLVNQESYDQGGSTYRLKGRKPKMGDNPDCLKINVLKAFRRALNLEALGCPIWGPGPAFKRV